ncbi:MAG: hypothetical protein IPM57_10800, partial [Oligoflexia bacterium]|nr:hypothetical protein [Oligoflexia bacterium]
AINGIDPLMYIKEASRAYLANLNVEPDSVDTGEKSHWWYFVYNSDGGGVHSVFSAFSEKEFLLSRGIIDTHIKKLKLSNAVLVNMVYAGYMTKEQLNSLELK